MATGFVWVSYIRTKGIKQTHKNNHYSETHNSLSKEWVIFAGLHERHRSRIQRALDLYRGTRSSLHLQHWNYHYGARSNIHGWTEVRGLASEQHMLKHCSLTDPRSL